MTNWTEPPLGPVDRPRPQRPDNTRAGLIVVGMLCATAVLISFACAFGMRAIG